MRSVVAEKVREAEAHSSKRWAAGPATSSNQYVDVRYDVADRSIAAA